MSKWLTFQDSRIRFPSVCLVCQLSAEKQYNISRTFIYGRRSIYITLPMPLCTNHYAIAFKKSYTERLVARVGLVLGIAAGLVVAIGLLSYWAASSLPASAQAHTGLINIWGAVLIWGVMPFVVRFAAQEMSPAQLVTRPLLLVSAVLISLVGPQQLYAVVKQSLAQGESL
jgi:hypothetical protein